MSNKRVRLALEAKSSKEREYNEYKKNESLLLNYGMCKAYFDDMSASVTSVVESILREKYNLPWQSKFIRKATMGARGKRNAVISIPQFKYEERVNDILSKFVKSKFDVMVSRSRRNPNYPFALRDMLEKCNAKRA